MSYCLPRLSDYTVPPVFTLGESAVFCSKDGFAVVYRVTNRLNGKRYFGVTGQGLDVRKAQHIRDALKGIGKGAFPKAIRKYGPNGFDWHVVDELPLADAIALEKKCISDFKPEYNSTHGGEGFAPRYWSPEAREKIAAVHRGNKYALGRQHDDATKEKLRQLGLRDKDKWLQRSHLGPAAMAKQVVCLNDGIVYPSAREAGRVYGVANNSITEICRLDPVRRTVGGLVFRYYGEHYGGAEEARRELQRSKATSQTGLRGISPCGNKWRAQIATGGRKAPRKIHIGLFHTPEEAHQAYLRVKAELG